MPETDKPVGADCRRNCNPPAGAPLAGFIYPPATPGGGGLPALPAHCCGCTGGLSGSNFSTASGSKAEITSGVDRGRPRAGTCACPGPGPGPKPPPSGTRAREVVGLMGLTGLREGLAPAACGLFGHTCGGVAAFCSTDFAGISTGVNACPWNTGFCGAPGFFLRLFFGGGEAVDGDGGRRSSAAGLSKSGDEELANNHSTAWSTSPSVRSSATRALCSENPISTIFSAP